MQISLHILPGVNPGSLARIPGVTKCRQVFPDTISLDSELSELRTLYVLDVDPSLQDEILTALYAGLAREVQIVPVRSY